MSRRLPDVSQPGDRCASLPVALDGMGGDHAPTEIVAGALQAADDGLDVVVVGTPGVLGDTGTLEVVASSEVIDMGEDPARAVRSKKDSSLVRTAELVRDGRACAMVSAGSTGAAMASALLRMGRLPGVVRPCIATPLPRPGRSPGLLLDAGANSECTSAMLVQFAQMGSVYMSARYGIADPSVGLLSIGEEPSKGTHLVKETHGLLADGAGVRFVGNVEGRDLLPGDVDVVVTDGFTGNVALKALEGALRLMMGAVLAALSADEEAKSASKAIFPHLLPIARELDPENTGGAMLLGVDGVCVISHGSSNATSIKNALRIANELASAGLVDRLASAVHPG